LPRDAVCAQKVRRADAIAAFNAWSFAVCAAFSAVLLLASIFFGGLTIAAVGITLALFAVAYFEFRGKRMLNDLNTRACRLLGWNQLALFAVIAAYCIWSIIWGFLYPSSLSEQLAQNPAVLQPYSEADRRDILDLFSLVDEFWPALITIIYGSVIIATLIYQGWNAWYYFTRRRFVEACLEISKANSIPNEPATSDDAQPNSITP
jgi:hypothetical protein